MFLAEIGKRRGNKASKPKTDYHWERIRQPTPFQCLARCKPVKINNHEFAIATVYDRALTDALKECSGIWKYNIYNKNWVHIY